MSVNKENFLKLVSKEPNNILERNRKRIKYRKLIRIKQRIILKWLIFKDKFA